MADPLSPIEASELQDLVRAYCPTRLIVLDRAVFLAAGGRQELLGAILLRC